MEVTGQLHALVALPPRERSHATHWIKGQEAPRASQDAVEKRKISYPCWESNPDSTGVQPIE
jgi:hypothetical protein